MSLIIIGKLNVIGSAVNYSMSNYRTIHFVLYSIKIMHNVKVINQVEILFIHTLSLMNLPLILISNIQWTIPNFYDKMLYKFIHTKTVTYQIFTEL